MLQLKFQLGSSSSELSSISGQLNAAQLQIQLLERVANLHTILENLKRTSIADIVPYSEAVAEAEEILNDAEDRIDTELEVWGSVQLEIERYKSQLLKTLEDLWHENIHWTKKDSLVMKLNPEKLKDLFQSLINIGHLDRYLCDWSSCLLDDILVPLTKADTVLQVEGDLLLIAGERPVSSLDHLEKVICNIGLTMQHLQSRLGFKVNETWLLELVGAQVADQFTKFFIKSCLKPTLPASSASLSSPEYSSAVEKYAIHHCYLDYLSVINLFHRVVQLENELIDLGFVTGRALGEFAANVDLFLADKQCLESLTRARQLMCRDLHETLFIKDNQDQTITGEEEADNAENAHLWKMLSDGGMDIKWSPFRFPHCQISKSTQDLIDMLTGLVQEAGLSSATERSSARLLFTVRSICELYLSVVPEYHRDSLEKLPFHAAVAHNNGMYMAHSMLTLGTSHLIKLIQQNAVPLMDLVGKFRQLAAQIFLDHMKRQRDQLLTILKEAGTRLLKT